MSTMLSRVPAPPQDVAPGPEPSRAVASRRLTVVDALRGVAIVLMAVDHSAFFAHVSVQAEHNSDYPTVLGGWGYILTGLLTNIAAPTFWLLSGVSIALLARSYRRRFGSEWETTRFLLIRAAILVVIDLTLIPAFWEKGPYIVFGYTFDLLSSLAVGMLLMTVLRFLPTSLLLGLMLALLVGFERLAALVPALTHRSPSILFRSWVTYGSHVVPGVPFPVLGWFPLMGLGFVLGRHLDRPALTRPRTWVGLGVGLLATCFALRWANGYGNFVPWNPARPWIEFIIFSKGPPSLTFMLFNLGWMALIFAAFLRAGDTLCGRRWRWLVTLGQASLFAYVLHLALYRLLGHVGLKLLRHEDSLRYALTFAAGLALLLPLAAGYRQLKRANPDSVLRYF
jgi:uncharacterized membrane protein